MRKRIYEIHDVGSRTPVYTVHHSHKASTMRWREIYVRRDVLTVGVIQTTDVEAFELRLARSRPGYHPPRPEFLPTSILQLLALPVTPPEVPHTTPLTTNMIERINHRLSQSQVLVQQLGEPIAGFRGYNLVEVPVPLLATRMIELKFDATDVNMRHALSCLFLAYGRRLFIAVKPMNYIHPEGLIIVPGMHVSISLPEVFNTSVRREIVEDHRVGERYLDPTLFLGISTRLLDPMIEAVEASWNGFLHIERDNDEPLVIRATGVRLSFARQPGIQGLQYLPGRMWFRRGDMITAAECLEKISVPHAEWLGVFVMKDEMGLTANHEDLDELHHNLLNEGKAYCYKLERGNLYMWSMHIGRFRSVANNLLFAVVPNEANTTVEGPLPGCAGTIEWQGILAIGEIELSTVAIRWEIAGRQGITDYDWGERLEFRSGFDVRQVLQEAVRVGKWAVRFLPDGDDFANSMRLIDVSNALMQLGRAFLVRIGDDGERGDLVLFATNHEGVGICLVGVFVDYGLLGL